MAEVVVLGVVLVIQVYVMQNWFQGEAESQQPDDWA
jgi:hypothetical protein